MAWTADPQPGLVAGPRIFSARHHDAVHGQGGLTYERPRCVISFRRHLRAQRGRAHLDPRRSHPRARRGSRWARLQGREIAVMTYIGDGGQSTGVTYEGLNFAAVQNLGLVLIVESNMWAYSTPSDMQ